MTKQSKVEQSLVEQSDFKQCPPDSPATIKDPGKDLRGEALVSQGALRTA